MADLNGDAVSASILADTLGTAPKKEKLLPTLAAVGLLTLVAIAGGAGVGLLIGGGSAPDTPVAATAPTAGDPAAAGKTSEAASPSQIVKLESIVTNVASPANTILRVDASIVIHPDEVGDPEVLAAQIQGDTLTFLRTIDLAQIEGARGLLHLREDLRERAKLRSPAVSDYLIQSLVAQ